MTIRVAAVEDDRHYRASLTALFTSTEGFTFAGGFASAEEAVAAAPQAGDGRSVPPWDLLLMDLALPGMTGAAAIRVMKGRLPEVPIVVVSVFEEPWRILEAICAGADGYLVKRTPAAEILAEVRSVIDGGAPLSAEVARTVLDLLRAQTPARPGPSAESGTTVDLTEREYEVLRALVRGLSYKQIGQALEISLDTVRTHIRHIYGKLRVRSVSQAVRVALERGLA